MSVKAFRRIGLGGGPADERGGLREPRGAGVGEDGGRGEEPPAREAREAPPFGAGRERRAMERSSASVWASQEARSRARRLGGDTRLGGAVTSSCREARAW